jgi:hypothetical protein
MSASLDAAVVGLIPWRVSLQRYGTVEDAAADRHIAPGIIFGGVDSWTVVVSPATAVFQQDYYLLLGSPEPTPQGVVRIPPDQVHLISMVQHPEQALVALLRVANTRAPWPVPVVDPPGARRPADGLACLSLIPTDTSWLTGIPAGSVDHPTMAIDTTAYATPDAYSRSICSWVKICEPCPPG